MHPFAWIGETESGIVAGQLELVRRAGRMSLGYAPFRAFLKCCCRTEHAIWIMDYGLLCHALPRRQQEVRDVSP